MTVREFYDRIGQDYAEVYERMLGSETLNRRFLKQFCEDQTFSALEKAVADGGTKQIFLEAHTLKGLSANLGLKPLVEKTGVLVELSRRCGDAETAAGQEDSNAGEKNTAGKTRVCSDCGDFEKIVEAFADIREAYQVIVKLIAEIE